MEGRRLPVKESLDVDALLWSWVISVLCSSSFLLLRCRTVSVVGSVHDTSNMALRLIVERGLREGDFWQIRADV